MIEVPERASPVIGCKVGSQHALWQTSDIRFAVRSPMSLCRTVGDPLLDTIVHAPQRGLTHAHVVEVCKSYQPNLNLVPRPSEEERRVWRI